MNFDPEYETFLQEHKDGSKTFLYRECQFTLKTRDELFAREEIEGMMVPFISCLVAYRKRLISVGYSPKDVAKIDGTAIGESNNCNIVFISHVSGAVCVHYADGTADAEKIASSIGEFLAGLSPVSAGDPLPTVVRPVSEVPAITLEKALKKLINALDKVSKENEEVRDRSIRELLYRAIYNLFIDPKVGYELPATFGLSTETGNQKVRTALEKFVAHSDVMAASKSLTTPEARRAAFQNLEVESTEGNTFADYFGYGRP